MSQSCNTGTGGGRGGGGRAACLPKAVWPETRMAKSYANAAGKPGARRCIFDKPISRATMAAFPTQSVAPRSERRMPTHPHASTESDLIGADANPGGSSEGGSSQADFIEVYPDALDRAHCAALIARFAVSGDVQPGRVGGGVKPELKDSLDLTISGHPQWRDAEAALNTAVFKGLLAYLRRYPHTLIAPLMLEVPSADGKRHRLTPERLRAMDDAELAPVTQTVFRPGAINLQRYSAGRGGYPYWHCELYPRDPHAETLHRHLLWTIYLNDDFAQGETEFLYQQRKIAPRTGSLLIAPAAFTHTHRGNRPQGGDKVIATSWVLFQRAEQLFGAQQK